MLQQEKFWEVEGDAPLMGKNRGFLKPSGETTKQVAERVSKWPSVISNDSNTTVSEFEFHFDSFLQINSFRRISFVYL